MRSGIPLVWAHMCQMVEGASAALDAVAEELPPDFPRALADAVFEGVRRHAQRFVAQGAASCKRVMQKYTEKQASPLFWRMVIAIVFLQSAGSVSRDEVQPQSRASH